MQPLGAAVLILAVANIHWGSTELTPALANPTPTVGKTATQANKDIETTKSQQSATKPVIVSPTPATNKQQSKETIVTSSSDLRSTEKSTTVFSKTTSVPASNSTLPLGPGSSSTTSTSGTHPGSTDKSTTVFSNTTSVPDSNSTLALGPGSSSTTSTSGTHPGPTTFGIQTELTTMFIDYSKPTQPVQDDSDLSSGPTPSAFEKTRFIAPAVMVPILLVGAVSFIVWKMCQSDPPGSDQNENPKYVSKTGSVQLLSVRTTTPQTDVK